MSYQYQPVGANPGVTQPVIYAPAPTTVPPNAQYGYGTAGVPISGPPVVQQRFEPVSSYRDPAFIVLFVIHLIGLGKFKIQLKITPEIGKNYISISHYYMGLYN